MDRGGLEEPMDRERRAGAVEDFMNPPREHDLVVERARQVEAVRVDLEARDNPEDEAATAQDDYYIARVRADLVERYRRLYGIELSDAAYNEMRARFVAMADGGLDGAALAWWRYRAEQVEAGRLRALHTQDDFTAAYTHEFQPTDEAPNVRD